MKHLKFLLLLLISTNLSYSMNVLRKNKRVMQNLLQRRLLSQQACKKDCYNHVTAKFDGYESLEKKCSECPLYLKNYEEGFKKQLYDKRKNKLESKKALKMIVPSLLAWGALISYLYKPEKNRFL